MPAIFVNWGDSNLCSSAPKNLKNNSIKLLKKLTFSALRASLAQILDQHTQLTNRGTSMHNKTGGGIGSGTINQSLHEVGPTF